MKRVRLSIICLISRRPAARGIVSAQLQIPEEASVQQIAEGLHVIRGAGGNIAVSTGPDGVFIVDNDIPDVRDLITQAIQTITDQPVDMVINTHWHFDHTGNNKVFADRGALIIAHENVHTKMANEQVGKWQGEEVVTPPAPEAARPVVTYDDQMRLAPQWPDRANPPRQTPGPHGWRLDHLLRGGRRVFHMGDNFFLGLYPVIDIGAGGTADGMIAAIDEVLAEVGPETIIIPGHGPVSDAEGLRSFRDMLDTVNKRIRLLVEEGKTEDEVVALKPTYNFDEEWAWEIMTPEAWTRLMYASVKRDALLKIIVKQTS